MANLNPDKLFVTFRNVTPTQPICPRKYTLTHSDITAELFLTIGKEYAFDKIGPLRDEVLAKWCRTPPEYILFVSLHVDSQMLDKNTSAMRYQIFKQELPLALQAIRYGDRWFFHAHQSFNYLSIWVYFKSIYPDFNCFEYWGTPADYY